ncbi:GNAT family N-acetyltransferase [Salidesulfovibrio onnuriiensis]|uniref:GNAT family N-acetyltransferase n=1 Tax=Salidesulfovibrio onnuriiensis TaxID=2583823 RepID=UPI0011CBE952|nr:N-acetyltransferase [Salidesulfovibrio onnuriiensis]
MNIRTETRNDHIAISRLHYAAFKGHPQHEPGAEPVEHRIVELLRDSGALNLSLVAELGGKLAGHVAMSEVHLKAEYEGWYLLGPIGVLPEHQYEGVGSALMRETIARMRHQNAAGIVLVGDPGFYSRFGFRSYAELSCPGVPALNVLALPFGLTKPEGSIAPHPAFLEASK